MKVLEMLRPTQGKVARRRRVSFLRSWVTYSPKRAKTTILVVELVLGAAVIIGLTRTVVWVQDARYQAEVAQYEESLVAPTDSPVMRAEPLVPDAPAVAPSSPTAFPALLDAEAEAAARGFMGAWLAGRDAETSAEWLATLKPFTDPTLFALFADTDRSLIPASTVTKASTSSKPGGRALTSFTLSDGSVIGVGTVRSGSGWVATDISLAD